MTKKEYVIKLLNALEWKRALARGLKILVESWTFDDQTIDGLMKIFADAIVETNSDEASKQLQKGHEFLKKLQSIELAQYEKEQANLDEMIENI